MISGIGNPWAQHAAAGLQAGKGHAAWTPMPTRSGAWEGHLWAGCPAPGLGSIGVPVGSEALGRDCRPRRGLYLGQRRAGWGYPPGGGGGSTFWREQGQLAVSTREPEAPPKPLNPEGTWLTLAPGPAGTQPCRGCVLPDWALRTWCPSSSGLTCSLQLPGWGLVPQWGEGGVIPGGPRGPGWRDDRPAGEAFSLCVLGCPEQPGVGD